MGASNFIGDITGKTARKEAEEKQQQAAAQAAAQAETARKEQQRIEQKFALTESEMDREAETLRLEREQQTELERRAGIPGEELLRELGPGTRQLLDDIAARQGKTSEQLFREEGGQVAGLLLDELSQPGALETFGPELDLVLQKVNQDAQRRGVFGGLPEGGIRFEQLGRAGVDLAIKGSRERLAQRTALAQNLFTISQGARTEAAGISTAAGGEAQQARGELANFLKDIQTLSQAGRKRQATGAVQSAQTFQPTIRGAEEFQQDLALSESGRLNREAALREKGLADIGSTLLTPAVEKIGDFAATQTGDFLKRLSTRDPLQETQERAGGTSLRRNRDLGETRRV